MLMNGNANGSIPAPDENIGSSLTPLLLQYWQSLLRWKIVILIIVASTLAIGLVATGLTAKSYTASSQIQVNREQKNVTNVQGLDSPYAGQDLEFYATQYALLKAKSLSERVARNLGLARSDSFFADHGVKPVASLEDAGGNPAKRAEILAKRQTQASAILLANVDIAPLRGSSLINVSYTCRSPERAAQVANAWVKEFVAASMDRQFSSTADARRFLEARIEQLREKLEQSERDVVQYASLHNIIVMETERDAGGKIVSQRTLATSDLEALNKTLIEAKSARIAAEGKQIRGNPASSPEALSSPTISSMRSKRAELAAEYAKLLVNFDPEFPSAVAVKRQIDQLDIAINQELQSIASSRQRGYAEALSQERSLQSQVDRLKTDYDKQRQEAIQYNILQRESDTNRQIYDALLQRYKEIGIAGEVGVNNIALVDAAVVPTFPSGPRLVLNLALALLAGLILAALAVLGLEQIDEGIRNPNDVRNVLDIPLLGVVPISDDSPLVEIQDPKSSLSEAYFSIRSTLAFATNHGIPSSLCVTSTKPGEGKSTSAYSLAEILSRTGKRVLLIDGDLRSPSMHEFFSLPNEMGLSNLLAGVELSEHAYTKIPRHGVTVMTTGPVPPNPSELLSSDKFADLLSTLQERFDCIIIDAPPVLGLADAPLIGRAAEAILFVVEAGVTSRRAAQEATRRLSAVGGNLVGAVVTKLQSSRIGYGYGYGYGYGRETEKTDQASSPSRTEKR